MGLEQLKYPIGRFTLPDQVGDRERAALIDALAQAPVELRQAVAGLDDGQLDAVYRPDGWTARQVAHHLADAAMNTYIRIKLALTEEEPTIKPFDEIWADLADSKEAPVQMSLDLYERLHERWVYLLRSLPESAFARRFNHPVNGLWTVDQALAFAVWHHRHHTAHIASLRERSGW